MLEFTILMPLLTLLSLALVDLCVGLVSYMVLTQIVREGVRIGTYLPELEEGVVCGSPNTREACTDGGFAEYGSAYEACESHPGGPPNLKCGHMILHQRIGILYGLNAEMATLNAEEFRVSSSFTRADNALADDSELDTVSVTISTSLEGWFLNRGFPITVSQSGPYLSRSDS